MGHTCTYSLSLIKKLQVFKCLKKLIDFVQEYEAYDTMAEKKMLELCQMLRSKWPSVHNIAIVHRLGEVRPKESSIVIAVTSEHRKASLEAVQVSIQ